MGNPPSTGSSIDSTLQSLREAIWSRRPILGEIMRKHGDTMLFDYAKDFMDVNRAAVLDPFKTELIDTLAELIGQRLGEDVGKRVRKQLKKFALVSTADHHATVDHPFWVNANIISALPFLDSPQPDVFSLIVLSFASVSLNNASGFSRGILFHGGMGNSSNLIRLPILPDKIKMGIVYSARAITRDDLDRAQQALAAKETAGEIMPERRKLISGFMEEYYGVPDVLNAPDLSTQITKVNFRLWPKLFHPAKGDPAGQRMLDLIYFEIETLVTELLLRRHLRENTLINRLLFNDGYRKLALQHFDGIPGAFSSTKGWGTYMFWAIDANLHRVRLDLEGNRLVSKNRPELSVDFTPEAIAKALKEKRIYPGMLLCYVMVSLYYGMKCLGGFCQVHDLTITKEAWDKMLRLLGETKEADALEPIQTKELGGDGMVLAYSRSASGTELFPATGIDMYFSEKDTSAEKYLQRSRTVKMQEMMNPMLPEMYTVLFSADERDPKFRSVTPEQILRETGLQEKLAAESRKTASGA